MENFNKKELRIHLICWSAYIFVEVVLAGFITGKFNHFLHYALFYLLNIGTFYVHSLWVMPLLKRKSNSRTLFFIFAVVLECVLYLATANLANHLLEYLGLREAPLVVNLRYLGITIWRASYFLLYGTGYFFLKEYLAERELEMQQALENERLSSQLVTAEKDFLRTQINPHLLFNTLSYIRHATKHNPENAALAIAGLTGMMEYALEDSKSDFVLLQREIEQVENLIRLNRLRFEHLLNLDYSKDIDGENMTILPIILLTLVENIFKHGIFNDPDYPATIKIQSNGNEILFSTSNLAAPSGKTTGSQTGLRNISARLERAYPGHYSFEYGNQGRTFKTELKIKTP